MILTFNSNGSQPETIIERKITRLAFLSRFTDVEAVAIDLASSGNTENAAMIRRYLSKVNSSSFIDLDRADTRDGVNALAAMGLISAERATEIITSFIQEHEVFYG